MALLSSKCDTSGCQGCWHQYLQQRPFNGRADWREVSLANASPAPLLWGWARAGRRHQDSRPMVLQSWAAVAPPLMPPPVCPTPSSHAWCHPPQGAPSHPPLSVKLMQINKCFCSFSSLWPERGAVGNEGMSEICPFPALWQLWEEQEDHLARRWGGQKALWTEEQKRWNVKPCAHWGQRHISQEIPWGQSFCTKDGRQREPEVWKCSQGSWLFVFLVALQIKRGKYQIFYALAEACFSPWERKRRRIS